MNLKIAIQVLCYSYRVFYYIQYTEEVKKVKKGKAWTDREVSRRHKLPDFKTVGT